MVQVPIAVRHSDQRLVHKPQPHRKRQLGLGTVDSDVVRLPARRPPRLPENGAAAGESPIALMTRAGHRSMQTTQIYLHLPGTVFRDEAAALERRLLGAVESSTDLSEPEPTSVNANPLGMRER
jgi:hypothetical protein